MKPFAYQIIDVSGLTLESCQADFHSDLLVYLDYIAARSVKRSRNTNFLLKNVQKELARLMSKPHLEQEVAKDSWAAWIAWIEVCAWLMGLTSTELHDNYLSGTELSMYSDQYVTVNEKNFRKFNRLTGVEQETAIRNAISAAGYQYINEWFDHSPLRKLAYFNPWNREMSTARFADLKGARRMLLDVLAECPTGKWISVESLIQHFKQNAPNFVLAEGTGMLKNRQKQDRYLGFSESDANSHAPIQIRADQPLAFERVEGRYIERFLEGMPLFLRYIEVGYDLSAPYSGAMPEMGVLRAFRVNDRFIHLIKNEVPEISVTVQPNHEILVVSEVYPHQVMNQLNMVSQMVNQSVGQSGPSVYTLRLNQKRVLESAAESEKFDPQALLQSLTARPLPQNVVMELREWAAKSDIVTLYEGFSLLEHDFGDQPMAPVIHTLLAESISPSLHLIKDKGTKPLDFSKVNGVLMVAQHDPSKIYLNEADAHLSRFAKPPETKAVEAPAAAEVKMEKYLRLQFDGQPKAFHALRQALVNLLVPVESNESTLSLSFDWMYEDQLQKAIAAVAEDYQIVLKE